MSATPRTGHWPLPIDVLVVCTGNICRSPIAAGLLRDRLHRAGIEATVTSAGLVTEGRPASEHGVAAMARRGVDIAAHRSRRVTAALAERADLIVGMELQHVREVAVLSRASFERTFTLPELAHRLERIGPRPADEPVGSWIRHAGAGRRPSDMMASRPSDEIADPIGGPAREYEATAAEIEHLVTMVVDHLFPAEAD